MRRQADSTWTQPKVISTNLAIDVSKMAADAAGNITAVWINRRQGFTDGVDGVEDDRRAPAGSQARPGLPRPEGPRLSG